MSFDCSWLSMPSTTCKHASKWKSHGHQTNGTQLLETCAYQWTRSVHAFWRLGETSHAHSLSLQLYTHISHRQETITGTMSIHGWQSYAFSMAVQSWSWLTPHPSCRIGPLIVGQGRRKTSTRQHTKLLSKHDLLQMSDASVPKCRISSTIVIVSRFIESEYQYIQRDSAVLQSMLGSDLAKIY